MKRVILSIILALNFSMFVAGCGAQRAQNSSGPLLVSCLTSRNRNQIMCAAGFIAHTGGPGVGEIPQGVSAWEDYADARLDWYEHQPAADRQQLDMNFRTYFGAWSPYFSDARLQ